MPSLQLFLSTYTFDPISAIVLLGLALPYIAGIRRLKAAGQTWPRRRTAAFLVAGVGSLAWIDFGFLGTYSTDLRWAFTTRITLTLLVFPLLASLGNPIALAKQALSPNGLRRLNKTLDSWPVRLMSNAVFAPLFVLVFFMFFVTPIAGFWRQSSLVEALFTVLLPLVGMVMVLPLITTQRPKTTLFLAGEFIIAFVELMLDAVPGVVLSISDTILDGVHSVGIHSAAWSLSALDDQHFSGNLLWMIAEGADLPLLIMLMIRWRRSDRAEARKTDELSDEDYEALVQQHLGSGLGGTTVQSDE